MAEQERYPFPGSSRDAAERWEPIINESGRMDEHMQRLYDAIAGSLDEGVFYTDEMLQTVTTKLGDYFEYPDDPGLGRVEGGVRGREVFYARKAVEENRERNLNREAIQHVSLGDCFKNVRFGDATYSTVTVDGLNKEVGLVYLSMTKRGTSKRFKHYVGASHLPIPGFYRPSKKGGLEVRVVTVKCA